MSDRRSDREQVIAALLGYGVWLASTLIAAGMAAEWMHRSAGPVLAGGADLVRAGVVLFILLPVARVALMLALFVRERDYAYVAISALVLIIIGASFVTGLWAPTVAAAPVMPSARPHPPNKAKGIP